MSDDSMNELPPTSTSPGEQLPPPPPPAPPRPSWWHVPVSREPDGRKIGGVVSGVARAFGFDVRTTRIATAIAAIAVPGVFALYIAAWILLPKHPADAKPLSAIVADRKRRPLLFAIGIIAIFSGFGSWSFFGGVGWGFALVAIGVVLWLAPNFGSSPRAAWVASGTPEGTGGTTTSALTPRRKRYPVQAIALAAATVTALTMGIGHTAGWWHARVLAGAFTVLAILIAGTILGIIVNRSWFGAPMLFVFALATGALLVTHPNLDGGFGDRKVAPTTIADASRVERLAAGRMTIDLTSLPLGEQTINIDAAVGFGELHVIVPAGYRLDLVTHVGAGHVVVDGKEIVNGVRNDDERTLPVLANASAGRTIALLLEVGGGEIAIDRLK